MGTQLDSLDISQMREFALNIPHDISRLRDVPPGTATTNSQQPESLGRPVNGDIAMGKPAAITSQPSSLSHSQPRSGNTAQPSTTPPRDPMIQQPRPQGSLPSTIADSAKERMLISGTQSQGDTQPVSPSVYDEYNNRSKRQRSTRDLSGFEDSTCDAQEDEVPHTIQQGETGHIDLLAAFEQPSIEEGEDIEELEAGQLTQSQDVRADIFPESRRFQAPKTPASHGRKRKRAPDTSSQGQDTPRLPINPFAGQIGEGIMGPSQLFQTTQAQTSPMTNLVPSDGLSERPSPNMHNIQRPSTAGSLSSPAKLPPSSVVRAVTEPQSVYVTMKESQEARERQLKLMQAEQPGSPDELLDDDFDNDTQLRRRLRQSEYSMEARNQLASITARARMVGRGRDRGIMAGTATTPSKTIPRGMGTQASEPVLISDDAPVDQGNISEEETEREEDVESDGDDIDELAEENKENVEVPRTISRAHHTSQVISSQPTPSRRRMKKPKAKHQAEKLVKVGVTSQTANLQQQSSGSENGTQIEAIADSQSSQFRAQIHGNRPRREIRAFSEPRSSLDSRILVPQSQPPQGYRHASVAEAKKHEHRTKSSSQPTPSSSAHRTKSLDSNTIFDRTRDDNASTNTKEPSTSTSKMAGSSEPSAAVECEREEQRKSTPSLTPAVANDEATANVSHSRSHQEPVPDSSNLMPSPRKTPSSASKGPSSHSIPEQSRASTLFETAREELEASPSKTHPQRVLQKIQSRQSSPRKSMRLRTMEEIAADPSPPDITGDIDVDINLLSNDDIDFQNLIHPNSPKTYSRKSRKGGLGQRIRTGMPEAIGLPPLPGTPVAPPSSAISKITPVVSSSPSHAKSPSTATTVSRHNDQDVNVVQAPKLPSELRSNHPATSKNISDAMPIETVKEAVCTNKTIVIADKTTASSPMLPGARVMEKQISSVSTGPHSVIAPNRVFAHFNGSNPAYHPATCLDVIDGAEPRYSVRFDDGTVDTISAYGVKKLELRVGDLIKVDMPGARTKNFIVEGMQDQQRPSTPPDPDTPSRRGRIHSTGDPAFPETDIHGYATVLASPKQRTSTDGKPAEAAQIAIPLTQIYFTQTLWTAYRNRPYLHVASNLQALTGLQTPSELPSTPSTPSSRTRRLRTSYLAQSRSMAADVHHTTHPLFKNMAFAITNVNRVEDSKRVKNFITSNGGVLLETGFDELFKIPHLSRTSSPKKNADSIFQMTSAAQDLGFVCLLADKHCRRAKFIQALALGIPCLATRWISDCIVKQRVLPWAPYLLPAGESTFLGGAIRSRNLQPFPAEEARLADIIDKKPNMLNGDSVLLIMEKHQEDTMKQHPLITHALGTAKIERAVNEEAAAKAVMHAQASGEPWDWVFSYDKEKEVEKRLFGGGTAGKKRKRGRESEMSGLPAKKTKTKVVGNEFVIQSLILGMLVDE